MLNNIHYLYLLVGTVLLIIGRLVKSYSEQLVWSAIYPPPPEQILTEATPYALYLVGFIFLAIGVSKHVKRAKE